MREELKALRTLMKAGNIDACIIPTTDFHGSEYVNDYFKCRRFISGFTGSAGTLVVTSDEAGLWTDGRYFLQAKEELKGSGIHLQKSGEIGVPSIPEFLKQHIPYGGRLAFDGRVISLTEGEEYNSVLQDKNVEIIYDRDLAGEIWKERPKLCGRPIYSLPLSVTGKSCEDKMADLRAALKEKNAAYHLITRLEETAWLFNLRGSDVKTTPVFFAFTLITPKEVRLYIFDGADRDMQSNGVQDSGVQDNNAQSSSAQDDSVIPAGVQVKNYFQIYEDIKQLPQGSSIMADCSAASYTLIKNIPEGVGIIDEPSPIQLMKAVKNPAEIESTGAVHIQDGAAVTDFICWLKREAFAGAGRVTEISASEHLEECRRRRGNFLEPSFSTIAGYGPDGAVVHYCAVPETDRELKPEGLFLVDSGGQYKGGTTDITRTIALGELTDKMRKYYTFVLKSHIALASCRFPAGTRGIDLDKTARRPLHEAGLDFNHGTGHGVGHLLSVHEGPNTISPRGTVAIQPGMITTDEPGVYIEGKFGIRLENELLCIEDGDLLAFESITLCPFDRDAIIPEMLTRHEREWLNNYHKHVYETLSPVLSEDVKGWLRQQTAEI